MQYHAESLCSLVSELPRSHALVQEASHALLIQQQPQVSDVCIIGYAGAPLLNSLDRYMEAGKLHVYHIPHLPSIFANLPKSLFLPFKAIYQIVVLLWMCLMMVPTPNYILAQLPPAIPTMLVMHIAARRHRARLTFDWHNYAYSLMGLTLGRRHFLVRLSEWHEKKYASSADGALCVSKAMQKDLRSRWNVSATVFHDRPPAFFKKSTVRQRKNVLKRLHLHQWHWDDYVDAGVVQSLLDMEVNRPAMVVTSTSWTPDEDFGSLLQAAMLYDAAAAASGGQLPRLLIIVTGRGPQRAHYEHRMATSNLSYVAFRTLWLDPEDYPLLLGAADIGISLHASSSGLDLPMKAVDMLGSGLPVLALSYQCIGELVQHGYNGLLFSSSQELSDYLKDLLIDWPACEELKGLEQGALAFSQLRWEASWNETALPMLIGRNGVDE